MQSIVAIYADVKLRRRVTLSSSQVDGLFLNSDGCRCVYCGTTSVESKLHVDHILPRSKGGQDVASNLATSCSQCNLEKYDRELSPDSLVFVDELVRRRNEQQGISCDAQIKVS